MRGFCVYCRYTVSLFETALIDFGGGLVLVFVC